MAISDRQGRNEITDSQKDKAVAVTVNEKMEFRTITVISKRQPSIEAKNTSDKSEVKTMDWKNVETEKDSLESSSDTDKKVSSEGEDEKELLLKKQQELIRQLQEKNELLRQELELKARQQERVGGF